MPTKGQASIPVAAFFLMTRRVTRAAKMEEIRAATMAHGAEHQARMERTARSQNLQRMRDTTNAQLNMEMAGRGLAMPGMAGPSNAAYIQAAAGRPSLTAMMGMV